MILLKLFVWKTESFFRLLSSTSTLNHITFGKHTDLVQLHFGLCVILLGPPDTIQHSKCISGLAKTIHYVVVLSSIISYNAAQVGEIFGHWKIFSVYLHWLGIWDIECHHLCLLQVDPQTYLFSICIKMVCLLLYVLVCVGDQSQIVSKVHIYIYICICMCIYMYIYMYIYIYIYIYIWRVYLQKQITQKTDNIFNNFQKSWFFIVHSN